MNSETKASRRSRKPYALVGAGRLTATVWKADELTAESIYQFNVFRCEQSTGEVSQQLHPEDVVDLVKLARVLSQVLVDDGCISHRLREQLEQLATDLDTLWEEGE